MVIVLPFIRPPKTPIKTIGFIIRSLPWGELETNYPDAEFDLYGFESRRFFPSVIGGPKQLESVDLTILDTTSNTLEEKCYLSLLDLCLGRWRYVFCRTKYLSQPISISSPRISLQVPRYSLTTSVLDKFSEGVNALQGDRKLRISALRWHTGCSRNDPIDTVLDCCSALESALSLPSELRLRLSLSVYHILDRNKKRSFAAVYEMYGIRNKFIHGGELPAVDEDQQLEYLHVVARFLSKCLKIGKVPSNDELSRMILDQYSV